MKKLTSLLLLLALTSLMIPSLAGADDIQSRTYIGWVTDEAYPEVVEDRIHVNTATQGRTWLQLPDDAPRAKEFFNKGVRFVLSAPQKDVFDSEAILAPVSVELLPGVIGSITEATDTSITLNVYPGGAIVSNPASMQLALDANTICPFSCQKDDFVNIVYDSQTQTALLILVTNG